MIAREPIETVRGKEIRLLVKGQYGIHRLLKVHRTGTGLITGSYFGQGPARGQRAEIKDIHFTYPPSGQYHQTVVFYSGRQLRVFHDRAEEKCGQNSWKCLDREEINEYFLFPVKRYKTPSFEEFLETPNWNVHIIGVGEDVHWA